MTSLPDLAALIRETAPEELPDVIGRLEQAKAAAYARLTTPVQVHGDRLAEAGPQDQNIDAAEAALRLGMSRDWLYRTAASLPFTVRIGRRVLFSARGLERWNRSRGSR